MTERDPRAILRQCTRFVSHHQPTKPHETLAALTQFTEAEEDGYGQGSLMANFEQEMATLLGKPAALFMPSGTMSQPIALRIWADLQHNRRVAFHPTSHLEIHEEGAYRELHHLQGILIGNRYSPVTLEALQKIREPFGTLLLELPQREIGGVLPSWDELVAMVEWARGKNIRLHLDGARLWETKPFYGRDYAEICALFDSVYVSLYKILEGISGAVLLGETDFITEARVWQRRHGGNLPKMYPFVLAAQVGLAKHLPQMQTYYDKTLEIAAALAAIEGIEITPNPPHVNMMHVFFKRDPKRLMEAVLDIAEATQTGIIRYLAPTQIPTYCATEITIGSAALAIPTAEITELFAEALRRSE